MTMPRLNILIPALLGLAAAFAASAEEGMWTLDNLPRAALKQAYQFEPTDAWVEQVQQGSVRLAGGCSGSFVSEDGLVLTNHHCMRRCLAQLSGKGDNLLDKGFLASSREQEKICPEAEVNQLIAIRDVSGEVAEATKGLESAAAESARKARMSALESDCSGNDAALRCDVVTLYEGGRYHLYKYRRFQDVRMVFAPEFAIGAFGGDPDNFNFPRYVLDMALLRVYQDGQPVKPSHHFRINPAGAQDSELVFVTGHPGATQRSHTVPQLITLRDVILPQRLAYLSELRGVLRQFARLGPEQARISQRDALAIENTLKAFRGRHAALAQPGFMEMQTAAEAELKARVEKNRGLRKSTAGAWDQIAKAEALWRDLYLEYAMLELKHGYQSDLFGIARHLVRAAVERNKPNGERLREYTEAALPQLTQRLFSAAPIEPELERLALGWSLEKLRELLGADHAAVRTSLGQEAPQALADRLINTTGLNDVAQRKALWEGGLEAIQASDDPMIRFALQIEPLARALRERHEDDIKAVQTAAASAIARARFELDGTDTYPDATFTLRLSYGQVKGWEEKGQPVAPFTTVGGAYFRATGADPFKLPDSWLAAEPDLDLTARMNFVSTHDIIGGNSGSPVLNRKAEVVGLIFDGNLHSLGGAYAYDGRFNRAVAVHPAIMKQALEQVYPARHLADELFD